MRRLTLILDLALRGKAAAICGLITALVTLYVLLEPLPWHRFPNVFAMFSSSWLYLAIAGSLLYSGMASVARRPGFPPEALPCIVIGLLWKFTSIFWFLPFNFSRLLILYGLGELLAHCIRRTAADYKSRSKGKAPPQTETVGPPGNSSVF